MKMTQDEKYMKAAIREAKKAYALDEVPIGCVIVQDGTIIARGYNTHLIRMRGLFLWEIHISVMFSM